MATKPDAIIANPSWTKAQLTYFYRLRDSLPILMGYLGEEVPSLDNHTLMQVVDETGLLKQVKKTAEKAEKAHVERLKARLGDNDSFRGEAFEAQYRGSKRTILNQGKCKEIVQAFDDEGINIEKLLAACIAGKVELPQDVFLKDPVPGEGEAELNYTIFHTTSDGGRSLYVEPIS